MLFPFGSSFLYRRRLFRCTLGLTSISLEVSKELVCQLVTLKDDTATAVKDSFFLVSRGLDFLILILLYLVGICTVSDADSNKSLMRISKDP